VKVIDETGKRYGKLLVLQRAGTHATRDQVTWLCQCDCGRRCTVVGGDLRRGDTTSCGCIKGTSLDDEDLAWRQCYSHYRAGAGYRGIGWDLSDEQFRNLCLQPCHYCGQEPSREWTIPTRGYTIWVSGIDRVNPGGDYTVDNVVPCCTRCNYAKREMGYREFIAWAQRVTDHQRGNEGIVDE